MAGARFTSAASWTPRLDGRPGLRGLRNRGGRLPLAHRRVAGRFGLGSSAPLGRNRRCTRPERNRPLGPDGRARGGRRLAASCRSTSRFSWWRAALPRLASCGPGAPLPHPPWPKPCCRCESCRLGGADSSAGRVGAARPSGRARCSGRAAPAVRRRALAGPRGRSLPTPAAGQHQRASGRRLKAPSALRENRIRWRPTCPAPAPGTPGGAGRRPVSPSGSWAATRSCAEGAGRS